MTDLGSNEQVTIRVDRIKIVLYAVAVLPIAAFLFFGPYGDKKLSYWEIVAIKSVAIAIVGIVWFAGIAVYIRPTNIVLSKRGIVYSSVFRKFHYYWDDITDVTYKKFWDGYAPNYWIVLKLKPGHSSGPKQFGAALDEGIIEGRGWPMSAEDLSKIIIDCRARWT